MSQAQTGKQGGRGPSPFDEALIDWLKRSIRWAVRLLAVLMMLVIWWGVADVIDVLVERMSVHPYFLLTISDILATFGTFMAVLIAIEIFVNIVSYLREDVIHIKIVLATAFMAVARKVIVLDYKEIGAHYVYATAALVLALCLAYWLTVVKNPDTEPHGEL
ncbi:phosphate-starvation-inducible PsiE family protein [Massilia sp. PWRC2]|uniref:phosphate-starvation-inducible PsiE family protein n=1 Tax=Massilia sp. PWRC2 TaxID=2804626 RepID=UPI003CEF2AF3